MAKFNKKALAFTGVILTIIIAVAIIIIIIATQIKGPITEGLSGFTESYGLQQCVTGKSYSDYLVLINEKLKQYIIKPSSWEKIKISELYEEFIYCYPEKKFVFFENKNKKAIMLFLIYSEGLLYDEKIILQSKSFLEQTDLDLGISEFLINIFKDDTTLESFLKKTYGTDSIDFTKRKIISSLGQLKDKTSINFLKEIYVDKKYETFSILVLNNLIEIGKTSSDPTKVELIDWIKELTKSNKISKGLDYLYTIKMKPTRKQDLIYVLDGIEKLEDTPRKVILRSQVTEEIYPSVLIKFIIDEARLLDYFDQSMTILNDLGKDPAIKPFLPELLTTYFNPTLIDIADIYSINEKRKTMNFIKDSLIPLEYEKSLDKNTEKIVKEQTIPALINLLVHPTLKDTAEKTLNAFGEKIRPILIEKRDDATTDPELKKQIIDLLKVLGL